MKLQLFTDTYTSHLGTAATDAYSLQKYNNSFNSSVQLMCTPQNDGLKILQFSSILLSHKFK